MAEKMTLSKLHRLYKLGQVSNQDLGSYWDEIAPGLLVAPPGGDVQGLIKWAGDHQRRAQMITDIFGANPGLVFENDRLGLVLLLGTDDLFRADLFRYYLADKHPEIPREYTCRAYAESPGDSLLGESWQGSVITQFTYLNVSPFQDNFCLSNGVVDKLDRDEVLSFISVLKSSITASLRLSLQDRVNLGILLRSPALIGHSSLIVQQCRSFWDSVAEAEIILGDAALSSMGATLRGVIADTSSFDLYQVVNNSHPDIAARFPLHLELIILNDLAQDPCRSRPDDNPDFPTFTLERVLGKSITTKKTQSWLLGFLEAKGEGQDGIDCLDEKIVFDEARPLLDKHREALMSKPSLLNPEQFTAGEIQRDIQAGRYFRVACRALLNETYSKVMANLPLEKLLHSECSHSEFFLPMLGGYFQEVSDERIAQAYAGCRKIKPQLDFLCDLFRDRFTATPPAFLLNNCSTRDDAISLLKELDQRGIAMPASVILRNKDIDPTFRDDLFSRDLGL